MTPSTLYITGLVMMLAAIVLLLLNLRSTITAGMYWIALLLVVAACGCIVAARKRGRK